MTAQERPTFRVGELVEVHIARAVVHNVLASSMMLNVGDGEFLAVPRDLTPVVQVRRLAPVEWPPVVGDLWRDSTSGLWFATLKAAQVGGDGRVFESARLVMAPARETPHLYREGRITPDALLSQYGPLELVHREPQPADPDGDE